MGGLRVLVIIMGALIVAGFAVLGATIAGRMAKPHGDGVAPAQSFTAAPLDIPAGARIETMAAGSGRLVLDLVLKDGTRELIVIDLETGRKLGTMPLRTAP